MVLRIVSFKKNLERPFGSVVEHSLGKGEVPGPIPGMGTSFNGVLKFDFDVRLNSLKICSSFKFRSDKNG
jgi:hypothetical protein